jgi:16S rRNA (adenine1518-N6/adenine1519-N6)-dimethyltransferase
MTGYLAQTGLPVHAIEVDPAMARSVAGMAKKFTNVEVIQADILQADLEAIRGAHRMKIYGSLPYYITSPILHRLFEFGKAIDEIHVVVQTEVAERLAAAPGSKDYGYLSVATQFYTRPEIVLEIPRAAFRPPPEVSSTLVTMRLPGARTKLELIREQEKASQAEHGFLELVKKCFAQKRKTLVNNLRGTTEADQVRNALAQAGLKADARAEQISIEEFAELYKQLR